MNVQDFKCTFFVHNFWFWCLRVLKPNYTPLSEVVFCCGWFLLSSSNISKTPFLQHLCTMAFIGSNEKDFIASTRDSFKACILACKISNQVHTNFKKRRVQQGASRNFVQKWLFCKAYVPYNIWFFYLLQKFLKNTFEVGYT